MPRHVSANMQLGPISTDFVMGRRKLMMDFRQKSPIKVAWNQQNAAKRANNSNSASSRSRAGPSDADTFGGNGRTIPRPANPIARKRSLQQIQAEEDAFDQSGWGDTDEEGEVGGGGSGGGGEYSTYDPIVLTDEETETDDHDRPAFIKARKSAPAVVGTARKEVAGGAGALARRRTIGATTSGSIKMASSQANGRGKGKAEMVLHVDDDADVDRGMSKSPVDMCCRAIRKIVNKVSCRLPS